MTTTETTDLPSVHEALLRVMDDVLFIGKDSRNAQQGFQFRGIDAVINKVGPAFRRHRVLCKPIVEDLQQETVPTRSGGSMRNTTVRVRFVFTGPAGDKDEAVVYGEAADAGDKSITKAQSVAYRTALIQVLCIPTGQPDPDSETYERGAPQQQRESSGRDWLKEVGEQKSVEQVQALWRECGSFGELTDEIRNAMTKRATEIDDAKDMDEAAGKEPATV